MTSEPKDTATQTTPATPFDAFALDGNRAEYERRRCEDAKAALIKLPKDGEPPQEKPRPDT